MLVAAAIILVLVGCGKRGSSDAALHQAGSAAASPHPGEVNPTFSRDVAPIVFKNCSACHRLEGAAPFSLLTYGEVRKKAETIVKVTSSRYMPPWLPVAGHGSFEGERRLIVEEIETLRRWHEQGCVEGDPKDMPAAPQFASGWQLGSPDLVLELPEPFVVPAEGRDVYRNFVIPIPIEVPRYIAAMEFRPDKAQVVHHAFMLMDTTRESRRLDAREPGPGFVGMNPGPGAQSPQGHFISWQPGKTARRNPPGLSWKLAPGTDLVLQIHMRPTGKPEALRPAVGLFFTDEAPSLSPFKLVLTTDEIDIPAGAENWSFEQRYTLPVPVKLLGVLPHAHYLGKNLHGFALLPDGSKRWLLRIDDWDFNWQGDYRYSEPVILPRGSVLVQQFSYDNSAANPRNPNQPPQRVRRGLQTTDEMGELWFQLLPADPEDSRKLNRDYLIHVAKRRGGELARKAGAGQASAHDLAELARTHMVLGQPADAEQRLRESIERDPDDPESHYLLGFLLAQQSSEQEARAELSKAVALRPNHPAALNGLGMLHLAHQDFAKAAELFRTAVAADPQNATPLTNLARAQFGLGRAEAARETLRRALLLKPDDATAAALLQNGGVE